VTVKQAIEYLNSLPDKEIMLMVDCPHCGKGAQLAKIFEAVILQSLTEQGE
jgi:hypothetical protein